MFPEALVEDCLIPSLGETELSGKEYRKAEKQEERKRGQSPKTPSRANTNDYTSFLHTTPPY